MKRFIAPIILGFILAVAPATVADAAPKASTTTAKKSTSIRTSPWAVYPCFRAPCPARRL